MKTKAIIFTSSYEVSIGEYEIPKPKEGEILTRTIYSGVSPGTELRTLAGRQHKATFPLIPGYENVGEVIEVGENVDVKIGSKVFTSGTEYTGLYQKTWGGHVEYSISKAEGAILIPENTDLLSSVFIKTIAIALHGIKRAKITEKDKVAIVGQGLIGLLASKIAKIKGALVIAIDTIDERLEASKKAGVDYIINAQRENTYEKVIELTKGGVDVAIDVTGIASTVDQTARLIRPRPFAYNPKDDQNPPIGRLLILGSYPDPICFNYHPTLFDAEIDIHISRDIVFEDLMEALDLIISKKISTDFIPYKVFRYHEAPLAYKELLDKKIAKAIFSWQ